MAQYMPRHEQITGADLTGSSGDANRTYILTNDDAIAAQMMIARDEAFLQQGVGFSFDAATNTVTFLTEVWDEQAISIDYFTEISDYTASTEYTNTLQIARFAGIGVAVEIENLGTGDGLEDSYDTDFGNIIDGSYTLYYGTSGSNSLIVLTETTHYTIYKDDGRILLTAAGKALVNASVIYITYMYSPKQSDTILATYLVPASKEAEKMTGDYWGPVKTSYDYFDGYDSGYPQTDEPFGIQIQPYAEFMLRHKGVTAITSVVLLDRQGSVDSTLDSTEYRVITDDDYQESRLLVNRTIPNGKANVKVTYTHGYSTVPDLVQELTALIGGMMALVNISGGSYKDISTYQLGRKSFSIGQVYINIESSIKRMQDRIEAISLMLGERYGCA